MHGLGGDKVPPACDYKNDAGLIAQGDAKTAEIVRMIQASPIWAGLAGWRLSSPGTRMTGRITTAIPPSRVAAVSSRARRAMRAAGTFPPSSSPTMGPHPLTDDTPYNHYSVLRTVEEAFGISEHLKNAGQ